MKYILILITALFLDIGCNKQDSSQKYDWQIVDGSGNQLNIVYNKTEQELIHCTTCGTSDTPRYLTPCEYYKIVPNEKPTCLMAGNTHIDTITQTQAMFYGRCFNIPFLYINSNSSCQVWLTRQRKVVKKNPSILFYSSSQLNTYCGDTLKELYKGKSVLLKETSDSAFYQEFITN